MWGCVRYVLDLPLIYHLQGLDVLELSGDSSISIKDEKTVQMSSSLSPSIHNHTVFTTSGLPREPSSLKKAAEHKRFLADFIEDCVRFRNYSSSMTSFNKKTAIFHFDLCLYIRSNTSLAGTHHGNLWTLILPKKSDDCPSGFPYRWERSYPAIKREIPLSFICLTSDPDIKDALFLFWP